MKCFKLSSFIKGVDIVENKKNKIKELLVKFLKTNKTSVIISSIIIIFGVISTFNEMSNLSFSKLLVELLTIIFGFIVSLIGGAIGELLRNYTKPDTIYSYGFWGMLKNKIFWAIGPQLIGSIVALYIVFMIIL